MVIKEVTIKEFNGGIAKDLRLKKRNKFGLAKNFDVFTYKHKIEPNLDLEDRTEASYSIVKFLASPITLGGVSNPILGFAKDGGFCAVYHWNGSIWDVEITNDTSSAGTRNENAFFYYKNSVLMFGGSKLKRFDADGTDAFDEDYVSTLGGVAITAFSNVAQPVHHLRDDIAYFFTDYFVHKLDDATWATDVLELPSGLKITSACSFGN